MKKKLAIATGIVASFLVCFGVANAIQTFDDAIFVPSLHVGSQGEGGVTFFNGTIINNTTDTNGNGVPVTFGDDVRIDGAIFRTEVGGANPLKISDSLRPSSDNTYSFGESDFAFKDGYFDGTLTVANLAVSALSGDGVIQTDHLASSIVTSAKILDATIATADLADSSVTSAKIADGAVTQAIEDFTTSLSTTESGVTYDDVAEIAMTTTGGKVFCVFSAYATTTAINQDINLIMSVDEELVARTLRKVTTSDGNGFNSISNNVILDLAAGAHIIKVIWNTSVGATANMTFPVLDCIELKK